MPDERGTIEDPPDEGAFKDAPEVPPADPVEVTRLADRILRGLGLDVECSARDAGETLQVDVAGPDHDLLLDRRGAGLSALQYLLNRIIYRGRRGKKIQADSGGFRKLREEELVEIARRAAEKAKAQGEEVLLSPLNPYERRLVHIALSEIEGVETQSRGDGFLKRVAIFPAGQGGRGAPRR